MTTPKKVLYLLNKAASSSVSSFKHLSPIIEKLSAPEVDSDNVGVLPIEEIHNENPLSLLKDNIDEFKSLVSESEDVYDIITNIGNALEMLKDNMQEFHTHLTEMFGSDVSDSEILMSSEMVSQLDSISELTEFVNYISPVIVQNKKDNVSKPIEHRMSPKVEIDDEDLTSDDEEMPEESGD